MNKKFKKLITVLLASIIVTQNVSMVMASDINEHSSKDKNTVTSSVQEVNSILVPDKDTPQSSVSDEGHNRSEVIIETTEADSDNSIETTESTDETERNSETEALETDTEVQEKETSEIKESETYEIQETKTPETQETEISETLETATQETEKLETETVEIKTMSLQADEIEFDLSANKDGTLIGVYNSDTGEFIISGNGEFVKPVNFPSGFKELAPSFEKITLKNDVKEINLSNIGVNFGSLKEFNIEGDTLTGIKSSSLEIVNAPNITGIIDYGYNACKNLISFNAPKLQTIPIRAFYNCTSLSSMSFDSVKSIGKESFCSCLGLTDLDISEVDTIGEKAFQNCTSLKEIYMPNVEVIGDYAFIGCTSLQKIEECNSLQNIGASAFSGCTGLLKVNIPNVIILKESAFSKCTSLSEVHMPKMEEIGPSAFFHCDSLDNINLFNTKKIGANAFEACAVLESIDISKVDTVGAYAFSSCTKLTSVIGVINSETVPESLFAKTNISSIELGDNVKSIEDYAFQNNTSLEEIDIKNVKYIGKHAFSSCSNLHSINLENVETIGNYAFANCAGINTEVILKKIKEIGKYAFELTGIPSVEIHSTDGTIGSYAFELCKNLRKFVVKGNPTIEQGILFRCENTEYIDFGDSVGSSQYVECIGTNPNKVLKVFKANKLEAFDLGAAPSTLEELNMPNCQKLSSNTNYTIEHPNLKVLVIKDGCTLTAYSMANLFAGVDLSKFVLPRIKTESSQIFKGQTGKIDISNLIKGSHVDTLVDSKYSEITYNGDWDLKLKFTPSTITRINWLGGIDSSMTKAMINSSAMIFCIKGSPVEAWCKNVGQAYTLLSDEEVENLKNGSSPDIVADSFLFNGNEAKDIKIKVQLGARPAGATGIRRVLVDNVIIDQSVWMFNGSDTITLKNTYLSSLFNGTHQVSVEFDNGVYRTGVTINVTNSSSTEIINEKPSVSMESKLFDAKSPEDIDIKISLGKGLSAATGISRVVINSRLLNAADYVFNGTDTVTIKKEVLQDYVNGYYTIAIGFNDRTYKTGIHLTVVGSDKKEESTTPPEALTTITYEFYKDYPDTVIIPVKMNSATDIVELSIAGSIVDKSMYEMKTGTLCIKKEFLRTLAVGKYRILPTFNDIKNTTIPNLMMIVYEHAADRAAPYLIQTQHTFDGNSFSLQFDVGQGDLAATNVLAVVLDDELILPNGDIKPFNTANVVKVQNTGTHVGMDVLRRTVYDRAFTVIDNSIKLNGDYINSLELSAGDHLIGAIFDNTERTTDVKKVILTITEKHNTEEPGEDPGEKPGEVPSEAPSEKPNDEPGDNPSVEPGDEPGEKPGYKPVVKPGSDKKPDKGTNGKVSGIINDIDIEDPIIIPQIPKLGDEELFIPSGDDVAYVNDGNGVSVSEIPNGSENTVLDKDNGNNKPSTSKTFDFDGNKVTVEEEPKDININYCCNCLSWSKILIAILLLTISNTFSLSIVFALIIPAINKKRENK